MRLFADDALLYYPVRTIAEGASLQHDLHTLHRWSKSWKMAFNGKKCHVMHVTRNVNITNCSYTLGQDKLTPVSHHPYLGVELDDHLNWKEQTKRARSKGVRMLNMVRRNFTRGTTPTIRCEIWLAWLDNPWNMAASCGTRINLPESRHSKPSKIKAHDMLTKTGTDTRVWQPWRKTSVGSHSRKDAWLTDWHFSWSPFITFTDIHFHHMWLSQRVPYALDTLNRTPTFEPGLTPTSFHSYPEASGLGIVCPRKLLPSRTQIHTEMLLPQH